MNRILTDDVAKASILLTAAPTGQVTKDDAVVVLMDEVAVEADTTVVRVPHSVLAQDSLIWNSCGTLHPNLECSSLSLPPRALTLFHR